MGSGSKPRPKMESCAFWAQQNKPLTCKNVKLIIVFWSTAWTATHLDVKLGQIRHRVQNSGQFSVPNDLVFFSGQALKIPDCPAKFGTDGHLKPSSNRCYGVWCYCRIELQQSMSASGITTRRISSESGHSWQLGVSTLIIIGQCACACCKDDVEFVTLRAV